MGDGERLEWLLLMDPPADGPWNMALDEALLEAAEADGLCALRLYAWDPPALSFGRHEPALRRYDREAIAARGLATVRRPTGGRAVWHHREVTYSVAARSAAFGSLRETYHAIHSVLAAALTTLGAAVRLATGRSAQGGPAAGACFAGAAGGEVVAQAGGKVVGSAQVRSGRAFLQHGSILLAAEQEVVSSVTRGPAEAPDATGLLELVLPKRATFAAVSGAVAAAAGGWGVPGSPTTLPASVRARAEALLPRYAGAEWTWRR
jgi:lipoate-protein ligase A